MLSTYAVSLIIKDAYTDRDNTVYTRVKWCQLNDIRCLYTRVKCCQLNDKTYLYTKVK